MELNESLPELLSTTAVICVTLILVRLAWVSGGTGLTALMRARSADWRETLVIGWSGLRGVVSLAIALALPLSTPDRGALLFITFGVILVTLVGQGLSLPLLTRVLGIGGGDLEDRQELSARVVAAQAAIPRIDGLAERWSGHLPLIDTLRLQYEHRATHMEEGLDDGSSDGSGRSPRGRARVTGAPLDPSHADRC
jgi:monovalent cation/hydrogen antiporter